MPTHLSLNPPPPPKKTLVERTLPSIHLSSYSFLDHIALGMPPKGEKTLGTNGWHDLGRAEEEVVAATLDVEYRSISWKVQITPNLYTPVHFHALFHGNFVCFV